MRPLNLLDLLLATRNSEITSEATQKLHLIHSERKADGSSQVKSMLVSYIFISSGVTNARVLSQSLSTSIVYFSIRAT